MNRVLAVRRGMLLALASGATLIWLASRNGPSRSDYQVPQLGIAQAKALLEAGARALDVRDQEKFDYRHLPNAALLPLVTLRAGVPLWLAALKTAPFVVYCNRGRNHGPEATHLLQAAGFTNVSNLTGGIEGWAEAGMPIVRA